MTAGGSEHVVVDFFEVSAWGLGYWQQTTPTHPKEASGVAGGSS